MSEEFLKDQVSRLSAELARQQGRPTSTDAATEPWLLNAEQLPPLLQAYDTRIAELEKDLAQALGAPVAIKPGRRGGRVVIRYRDAGELDRLLNRFG